MIAGLPCKLPLAFTAATRPDARALRRQCLVQRTAGDRIDAGRQRPQAQESVERLVGQPAARRRAEGIADGAADRVLVDHVADDAVLSREAGGFLASAESDRQTVGVGLGEAEAA